MLALPAPSRVPVAVASVLIALTSLCVPALARAEDAAAVAPTEPSRAKRFLPPIGPEAGVFQPISARSQHLFGGAWLSFSPGIGEIERAGRGGLFSFDFDVLSSEKHRNLAIIAPIGIDYRVAGPGRTAAYVGAGANAFVTYLSVPALAIRPGVRVSPGGSAFVGVTSGDRAYLEVRYRALARIRGLEMSGGEVLTGLRF